MSVELTNTNPRLPLPGTLFLISAFPGAGKHLDLGGMVLQLPPPHQPPGPRELTATPPRVRPSRLQQFTYSEYILVVIVHFYPFTSNP